VFVEGLVVMGLVCSVPWFVGVRGTPCPGLGDPCRQPSFGTPQKKAKGRSLKRREGLAQRKYPLWVLGIRALCTRVVFRN